MNDKTISEWDSHEEIMEQVEQMNIQNETILTEANQVLRLVKPMPPANSLPAVDKARVKMVFDHLSNVINNGGYDVFEYCKQELLKNNPGQPDLHFVLNYLDACSHSWRSQFEKSKKCIGKAMDVIPLTTSPVRHLVEIMSTKCWLALKEHDYEVLQNTLAAALQTICQHQTLCSGMVAGWIFVDEARHLMSLASKSKSDVTSLTRLHKRVINFLKASLDQFQLDTSKDGPFGFCLAGAKLASVILNVGDELQFLKLSTSEQHIIEAKQMISYLKDYLIPTPPMIQVQLFLAESDLGFRKGHIHEAHKKALDAVKLSQKLGMKEELAYAQLRLRYYDNFQTLAKPQEETFSKSENNSIEIENPSTHKKQGKGTQLILTEKEDLFQVPDANRLFQIKLDREISWILNRILLSLLLFLALKLIILNL